MSFYSHKWNILQCLTLMPHLALCCVSFGYLPSSVVTRSQHQCLCFGQHGGSSGGNSSVCSVYSVCSIYSVSSICSVCSVYDHFFRLLIGVWFMPEYHRLSTVTTSSLIHPWCVYLTLSLCNPFQAASWFWWHRHFTSPVFKPKLMAHIVTVL